MRPGLSLISLLLLTLVLAGCARGEASAPPARLRLATTTSTADSGLLDALLPAFEAAHRADVEIVAVGTGQALALGERGDADVVLVHARDKEEAYVAAGHGGPRSEVMVNDFVLVGPTADPATIRGSDSAVAALASIGAGAHLFVSRGDESGTHSKERALWRETGLPTPAGRWYLSLGQGMGETLMTANELAAYTLADRGTFLAMRDELPELEILVGGATLADNSDPMLRNVYSAIPTSAERHPGVNRALAEQFVTWLLSAETQARIAAFGRERYGQPLFHPILAP